jgi:hypothetical protein
MLHAPIIEQGYPAGGVWRSLDVARVNALINPPSDQARLDLGMAELDATAIIADPRNIVLMAEYGGAMFIWTAPDTYSAHDFFLPEGRGAWARDASKAMLGMMFDGYGAEMIWAQTPVENRACRLFNRMLGFKSHGVSQAVLLPGSLAQSVETFVLKGGDLCL